MSNVNSAALMINKSDFINPNKYMELVNNHKTLGSAFSERSNSFSSSSSIHTTQAALIKPTHAKRSFYDLDAAEAETNVKKVNEISDTCLLDKQLCVSNVSPVHQASAFTCKICLNKFSLTGNKPIVSVNNNSLLFSSLYLDSPATLASSSSSLASNSSVSLANKTSHKLPPHFHDGDDNRVFQIDSCKCKFCTSCLNYYIKESIKNFNVSPLHCPDSKCGAKGFLTPAEIKFLLDGPASNHVFIGDINDNLVLTNSNRNSELFEKYLKICENIEILRNPNKIHCPQPECQNVCVISRSSESNQSNRNVKVSCDKCRHEFCSTCFKKWNDGKSDAYKTGTSDKSYDDDMISSVIADDAPLNTSIFLEKSPVIAKKCDSSKAKCFECDVCECDSRGDYDHDDETLARQKTLFDNLENIKRCPKCSVLIEKADGCAQIMCKMCKHTFCFYCLTSLDNDFLLKHYTKNGPCKGKLGHSRLSLLFHRFSVIAIFGGTILLIILLSPFLLLSLPCLVFSRKFRKSCFKLSSKFG